MAIRHLSGNRIPIVLLLTALCFVLSSCTGKHSFLMVQFCLAGQSDLEALKSELVSIAQVNGMTFFDNSAEAKRELEQIHVAMAKRRIPEKSVSEEFGDPVIHMSVSGNDAMGLSAVSVGSYQVAVAFSEGSDPAKARGFADDVVRRLGNRWHLKAVPAGTGAFPMKACE